MLVINDQYPRTIEDELFIRLCANAPSLRGGDEGVSIPVMKNRPRAVSHFLKREISEIIARDMRDPRMGFATVARVDMSHDLKYARVYVSVLGSDREKEECLKALNHARGYIQHRLSPRTNLKYMPVISFVLDLSIEYSLHIDEVLKKIEDEKRHKR